MPSLAAQVIDQRVSGIVGKYGDVLAARLGLGRDENRLRSAAFLFLVAKTELELDDDEALDAIVDGGNDFGVDILGFDAPEQGEIRVAVVQGKYSRNLDGQAAFPENGVARLIDAIDALFDPGKPFDANERLWRRVEEARAFHAVQRERAQLAAPVGRLPARRYSGTAGKQRPCVSRRYPGIAGERGATKTAPPRQRRVAVVGAPPGVQRPARRRPRLPANAAPRGNVRAGLRFPGGYPLPI